MEVGDLLGGVSLEVFKWASWIIAVAVGVVMYLYVHRRQTVTWPLFEAVMTFLFLNAAIAVYIIADPKDPRWSTGNGSTVSPPTLPEGGILGEVTGPLNDFAGNLTGGVNEVLAFKDSVFAFMNAVKVAMDFIVMAGWASLAAAVTLIAALIAMRHRKKVAAKKAAEEKQEFEEAMVSCLDELARRTKQLGKAQGIDYPDME